MNNRFFSKNLRTLNYCYIYFLIGFSFLTGNNEPKWFLNSTLKGYPSSEFYIGVGSGLSFKKALEEAQSIIAGQLEVSIKSTIRSNIISIEENGDNDFKDSFSQNTESFINLSINGIEVIESDKSKLTHYVFAVLNKQKYSNGLKVELDGLMNSMISYQKSGKFALQENKIFTSIQHYMDLQEILPVFTSKKSFYNSISMKPYIDNPDLSLDVVQPEIGKIISDIKIEVVSGNRQSATSGRPLPNPIIVNCYHKKTSSPLSDMPLIAKYKKGEIASRTFTDKNGNCEFYLNAISSGNKKEKIMISPNFSNLGTVFKKYLKNTSLSVFYSISEISPISFDISITDKNGNVLNKVENKLLKSLQKLGHYSSENSKLLISGIVYNLDQKEIEGKDGLQYLVKSELDLFLSIKEDNSKLSSFTIIGKGLSKKGFDDAYRKSHQKFKIGQRGLSEVLSNAEEKLNKVFYNNSKLKLEEGEELFSNNKFKEALKVLSLVTHDEKQSKNALELIEKIKFKLEDLDNQKYYKIEEENRIKREHELNLARIAAEKEISKVGN